MTVTDQPGAVQPPAWIAWRRQRGGKWALVGTGASEREAADKLFEAMRRERHGSFDTIILPAGQEP